MANPLFEATMFDDPLFSDLIAPEELPDKDDNSSKDDPEKSDKKSDDTKDDSNGTDRRNNKPLGHVTEQQPGYWDTKVISLYQLEPKLKLALERITQEFDKNLKSVKYSVDPYKSSEVVNMMYLLLRNDRSIDYDIVPLGFNVNDSAYLTKNGKVLTTFSHTMPVKYSGGPDGRRKKLSINFRTTIKGLKKVINALG